MDLLTVVLTVVLAPIIVTMFWEFFLRDRLLAYIRRFNYRLSRKFSKERPIGELLTRLNRLCLGDSKTSLVMEREGFHGLALDACFEIIHSHLYKGWRSHEIEYLTPINAPPTAPDLDELILNNPAQPPNNGKYRLISYVPDSSERPTLQVQLASTDYNSTYPIQQRLFQEVLKDSNGAPCSPYSKYGRRLLDFGEHILPNIVCLHAIVILPGDKLLVTRRVRSTNLIDWHAGKWSCSFEEQMTVKVGEPRNDKSFVDTAHAGCEEELGLLDDKIIDIRILSLLFESEWNVVDAVALIRVHTALEDIQAYWQLKARDGVSRELRNVEEIDWHVDAIRPILERQPIRVGKHDIAKEEWHGTSRMRLLQSLFHRNGIEETIKSLTE